MNISERTDATIKTWRSCKIKTIRY